MPLALLALTISAFAIGTTEFVIVGLVPTIADQLSISPQVVRQYSAWHRYFFALFETTSIALNQPGKRTGSTVIGILGHTFNAITHKPLSGFVSKRLLILIPVLHEAFYRDGHSDQSAGKQPGRSRHQSTASALNQSAQPFARR